MTQEQFFEGEKFVAWRDFVGSLFDRWQDEQKYESFGDYQMVIRREAPKPIIVDGVNSKPFTVSFSLYDKNFILSTTASKQTIKRLA